MMLLSAYIADVSSRYDVCTVLPFKHEFEVQIREK